jgi:hypothetical protein
LEKPRFYLFRHSGLDPGTLVQFFKPNGATFSAIQCVFLHIDYWIPDQVRYDGDKLNDFANCDTASNAGIQRIKDLDPRLLPE